MLIRFYYFIISTYKYFTLFIVSIVILGTPIYSQAIIGGEVTNGYPEVGFLRIISGDLNGVYKTESYCTATLVGKQTILTAGHCISKGFTIYYGPLMNLTGLSTHFCLHQNDGSFQCYELDKNKFYLINGTTLLGLNPMTDIYYDFAFIKLKEPLPLGSPQPRKIVTTKLDKKHKIQVQGSIIGYGCGQSPAQADKAPTKRKAFYNYSTTRNLLRQIASESTLCYGDSGGPILDSQGNIIGISVARASKDGINNLLDLVSPVIQTYLEAIDPS